MALSDKCETCKFAVIEGHMVSQHTMARQWKCKRTGEAITPHDWCAAWKLDKNNRTIIKGEKK